MDHTPDKCPNRAMIESMVKEIDVLKKDMHIIDKETSIQAARQDEQYKTIIEMLSVDRNTRKEIVEKVAEIERNLAVNEYQTNTTSNFLNQLNFAVILKLVAIITGSGVVISAFVNVLRSL